MHPLLVGCYETFLTENFFCFVTELALGGDFSSVLRTQPGGRLTESVARSYFQQLIIALEYAHTRGVSIGNLRLANLFFDSVPSSDPSIRSPFLKLHAFGYSKAKFSLSPTIVDSDTSACNPFDEDIRAAGVILYQLLTGVHPCTQGGRRCSFPSTLGLSEEVQDLINRMLHSKPENSSRLQDTVTNSSWFQQDLPPGAMQLNQTWLNVAPVLDEYPVSETPALLNELMKRAETVGNPKDPFIYLELPYRTWLRRELALQEQVNNNNNNNNNNNDPGVNNTAAAKTTSTASSSHFNCVSSSVCDTEYDGMGISDDNMS
ncbi:putative Serine/threonine-protein kinase SRK2C [Nannochloris sp. 'desiccata']|nr:putative Serine/threonine-protein kinase SRK2C [Chlorella desiccata (nom. nud.)]